MADRKHGGRPDKARARVYVLHRYRARYVGRAEARGGGNLAVLLIKADGTIQLHDMAAGHKPLFYNPPGRVSIWTRRGRLHIRSTSKSGEILHVSGEPTESITNPVDEPTERTRRIRQQERHLVEYILAHAGELGLPPGEPDREALAGGGRVDLLYPDGTVVEVKKTATIAAYDQAQRYLRGGAPRVIIACVHGSENIRNLCQGDQRVNVRAILGWPPRRRE